VSNSGRRELAGKAWKQIYERKSYAVLEKRFDREPLREGALTGIEQIEVREAAPDEILAFAATLSHNDLDMQTRVLAYLSREYKCALAFSEGIPIGWWWWTDSGKLKLASALDHQIEFFRIELQPGDVWCFKGEILRSHRGRGRAIRFVREVERLLRSRGYTRMMGYIDVDNLPARWLYDMCGLRPTRTFCARYFLRSVGLTNGHVVVRVSERRRGPATFPYRRLRLGGTSA
jgi:GNAT superfamily N-acetyltransferase